jgi:ESCRT-II complex subunit VPS22
MRSAATHRLPCLPSSSGLQEQFKRKGEEVAETKAAVMRAQMAHFKQSLEEFALKYRADIRRNPEFRRALVCSCGGMRWC